MVHISASNLSASRESADTESDNSSKSLFGIRISWDAVDEEGKSLAAYYWSLGVFFVAFNSPCIQICVCKHVCNHFKIRPLL